MSKAPLSYGLTVPKKSAGPRQAPPAAAAERNLSSLLSAKKHSEAAQDIDASIYDYDGVYDAIHAPAKQKSNEFKGPKYMANLLAAAETRKRDQLRAKEKMLAKEREAEGEEFMGKEKFVTGAYKAQQEEVRRLEEEERKRETAEAERRRKGGGGMRELYKGLLDREEKRHDDAVKAVEEGRAKKSVFEDEEEERPDTAETDVARERGAAVNEDGQVVDKRDLLRAGLNVKARPKESSNAQSGRAGMDRNESASAMLGGRNTSKQAMRERQSRMLEAQLEAATKRAAEDERVEQEAIQRAAKSRKTDGEISSAKERYLQRKREAEAAKAAAAASES